MCGRAVSVQGVAQKEEIVMDRFWRIFWKLFGIIVLGALVVSGIAGIVTQSADMTYQIAQKSLVSALGIGGIVGLTVPVGLYFDERKQRRENRVVKRDFQ
jgi:uncharacterized protein involved in exopolysaccharide biosynthesis